MQIPLLNYLQVYFHYNSLPSVWVLISKFLKQELELIVSFTAVQLYYPALHIHCEGINDGITSKTYELLSNSIIYLLQDSYFAAVVADKCSLLVLQF